ncbi:MAG TPA: hypothetical protein VGY56_10585 [Verrucomicrobiae bacterium]|nr:hypothetical protein [Verrucomicrobiae bacterium]
MIEFLQELAEAQPLHVRAKLYLGMAHSSSDKTVAASFRERARILTEADSKCAQLNLSFPNP